MKAAELKELIAKIPDDEEIFYGYYDDRSEEHRVDDSFDPKEYWFRNGQKFWLLSGYQPDESLDEEEFASLSKWMSIINSFPQKEGWSLENNSSYDCRAYVVFESGSFKFKTALWRGKNNKAIATSFEKYLEFDSWEDFFIAAKPFIKQIAEKHKKDLEILLED